MTSTYLDHDVAMAPSAQYRFAIDRGGTFTDLFAECPDGSVKVLKLLSDDPKNYQDAPVSSNRDKFSKKITGLWNRRAIFSLTEFCSRKIT